LKRGATLSAVEERVLSGRYRVIRHLARGGMADVYEAEDTLLGRSVAVKLLHANFASDDAFVARFRREAQAAANLSHPNIVAIYDWGQDEGTYFMVMELIRGRTLREIIKTEGALLPRRSAEISAETAAALAVAHQHGVFHRDIKPGNIMIAEDGSVKVTDFGIARALDDSEELTRTGAVIGTATYFSPEQAQGLPADERSDVYSLGIVLYEMLAGKPPFTGESPVAVAYQHVSEPATAPDAINPEVPRELAAVAEHAIEKKPADRYQTADQFRADLLLYLSGNEPVAAAAFLAAAPTAMIAASVPPPPLAGYPGSTTAMNAPVQQRSQAGYWAAVGALIVVLFLGLWLMLRLLSGGGTATGTIEIPELVGIPAEQAFEILQDMDLKVRAIQETSEDIAVGLVIRTEPSAGTEVEPESFVDVVVSLGPETFGVPNVIGENVDVAASRIEDQGFTVGNREYVETDDVDENLVIAQSPDGGSAAAPGTAVDLIVSAGPSSIEVPDVSGKSAETAVLELARAGFENIETAEAFSPDVLEGFVIETNPAAGQTVPRDATIIIVVSQGPEPVAIPDLVGMSTSQAEQTLNTQGLLLSVSSDTVEVSVSSGLVGNVADQDPGAGVTVDFGSTVTVKLGIVRQVTVPDVLGMDPAAAQNEMSAVGLSLDQVGSTDTNDLAQDNTIATQDPSGGDQVDEGSIVNATVYIYQPVVPDFAGMTLSEAQAAATNVGLGAVSNNTSMDVPNPDTLLWGTIAAQIPTAGSTVPQGTDVEVGLYVAPP
jgi:beta-lactam-binding protein with PASTA domain/predicted Ser/Thr protein kinase